MRKKYIFPLLCLLLFSTSHSITLETLSLRFSSDEPLIPAPTVAVSRDIGSSISCNKPIDVSGGESTTWIVECHPDSTFDEQVSLTLSLQKNIIQTQDSPSTTNTLVVKSSSKNKDQPDTQNATNDTNPTTPLSKEQEAPEGDKAIDSKDQTTDVEAQVESMQDQETYDYALDDTWLGAELIDDTLQDLPIEYEEFLCSVNGVRICERLGSDRFMLFHRHLGCSGVVTPETDCVGAECERSALRQEVAGMSVQLGRHRIVNPTSFTARFTDIDYTNAATWVTGTVETGLKHGFISPYNDLFRPQDTITRAEAFGMMMRSVCMDVGSSSDDWHMNVYTTAIKYNITNRDFISFDPSKPVLRQEVFVIASRLTDYVNETGGCYAKISCEEK